MHPAFALSFSTTGISLHHRSEDDWYCVGEVPLDAPDLTARITALAERGFALANDLSCTVVLPEDQVRFLKIDTADLPPEDSDDAVREALTGSTPYELRDLAYDTVSAGETTFIAAVARQTLEEAQTFVKDHGFIPVNYSVDAEEDVFPAIPRFTLSVPTIADDQQADGTGVSVHAIAATTSPDPDAFRPAPAPSKRIGPRIELNLPRYAIPAGFAVVLALVLSIVLLSRPGPPEAEPAVDVAQAEPQQPAPAPEPQPAPAIVAKAPEIGQTSQPDRVAISLPEQAADNLPDLSPADQAILEALKVAPTPVEPLSVAPEPPELVFLPGIEVATPQVLAPPLPGTLGDLYLASIDRSGLSSDAVALPAVQGFGTDAPLDFVSQPTDAGTRFVLDERGLVTPTEEGTLNPDGVIVYLGRPSKTPPDAPVRFEEEPVPDEAVNRLAEIRPKPRPDNLIERFERQQLGGRTRQELAVLRPKLRPASVQERPQIDETPTALAVVRVPRPNLRPASLKRPSTSTAANLGSTAALNEDDAGSFQPRAVAPKIPSSASVARQATINNAINLRKLNLIGVYGTPANRRALVRLPSGRYKKLKVGDRLDGGNVIAISDTELRYQKRGQNLTLKMPRG